MRLNKPISSAVWILPTMIVGMSCQNSKAQTSTHEFVPTEATKIADQNYKKLLRPINRLSAKVKLTKSLSDAEIAKLKEIEFGTITLPLRGRQAWGVREEALTPFTWLTPKTLKPGQERAIVDILKPILTADDTHDDPEGFLKMDALHVIKYTIRDKSLLPIVRELKKDKRSATRNAAIRAEEALLGSQQR